MTLDHRSASDSARRIVTEFRELPGLRLTVPQAARMWALDRTECEAVLDALVDAGILRRFGGTYARGERAGQKLSSVGRNSA
jgi:hypothetical protein